MNVYFVEPDVADLPKWVRDGSVIVGRVTYGKSSDSTTGVGKRPVRLCVCVRRGAHVSPQPSRARLTQGGFRCEWRVVRAGSAASATPAVDKAPATRDAALRDATVAWLAAQRASGDKCGMPWRSCARSTRER